VHYRVRNASDFHGQRLVIFGGGDSALDWVIDLTGKATSIVHVHRRAEFKAAPASVARMQQLVTEGRMKYVEGIAAGIRSAEGRLTGVTVKRTDGTLEEIDADHLLAFFGLHPSSPIAEWASSSTRRPSRSTREVPDQRARHLRHRRHQHLSRQEEADPERLPRSGAAAFAIAEHLNPAKKVTCSTRPPARSCRSGSRERLSALRAT